MDGALEINACGDDVNAFIYAVKAHALRAQHPAIFKRKQHLERHGRGPRIISCMRHRVHQRIGIILLILQTPRLQLFFVFSGACNCQVKHLGHAGAHAAFICFFFQAQHVGSYRPALLVGRTSQRDHGRQARHKVFDLNHIPHGVNVRIACLHAFIDHHAAALINL